MAKRKSLPMSQHENSKLLIHIVLFGLYYYLWTFYYYDDRKKIIFRDESRVTDILISSETEKHAHLP